MKQMQPVLEISDGVITSLNRAAVSQIAILDKEVAVTYREEFISLRVVFAPGHGYQARVKLTEDREFVEVKFNYQEAKSGAFRKAAEAIGV